VEQILPFIQEYHLLGIFVALLACGFGFPMPEDVILIAGGILAQQEGASIWPSVVVAYFGVIIGDGVMFTIGRRLGTKLLDHKKLHRIFSPARRARVENLFSKWGAYAVFAGRFAAGVRAMVFMTAGAMKVRYSLFFVFDSLAAILSVPLFIWVGSKFGENLEAIKRAKLVVGGVVIGLVLLYTGYKLWKKRRDRQASLAQQQQAASVATAAQQTPAQQTPH
jgi:membrane protein DedA with SNARE-associated domain